jgi:hypothetical protein
VLAVFAIWLMLVWLTQYAFKLIDDIANGVTETEAASAEMLSPLGDGRCWVHPALAAAIAASLYLRPEWPRLPVIAAAALFFPASIGAIAMSGRVTDAVNPRALGNVIRGMAHYYVLAVLFVAACTLTGWYLLQIPLWSVLRFAALELLVLLGYAFIGGALFERRLELAFEPRISPERVQQRAQQEHSTERQRFIDALYSDLRVRQSGRAVSNANKWLENAGTEQLRNELQAILDAGRNWPEPRGYALLLRGIIPQLLAMKQLSLALAAAESGLGVAPTFAPETETDATVLIRYAQHTGRKRVARALLQNALQAVAGKEPGAELRALQSELMDDPTPR